MRKSLKNWDNNTWLSSKLYISQFNAFLLKKKRINNKSYLLDIGCGRGKIFGTLSRKLKLEKRPVCVDTILNTNIDKSIDFRNESIFSYFRKNNNNFDLIMIKQTIHLFKKKDQLKLINICKRRLNKNGKLFILLLCSKNCQIPCFNLMKKKFDLSLNKGTQIVKRIQRSLKYTKTSKFIFYVSINKDKYIQMIKKRFISCLIKMKNDQIVKGIKEIKKKYRKKIFFKDTLLCLEYKKI